MFAAVLLSGLALAASGGAPTQWDGVNPFRCELQPAGLGTEVKHPDADPYCVDFDKTHQNVTDLGVADFLSNEPARVASAAPKCFYFQSDHWRGSIVQDDGTTKTYEWDGHYFFNKATGDGGAWVTNFNVNGTPGQTGGAITHDAVEADASCAAKEKPYAKPGCVTTAGRPLGPVRLGMTDGDVRAKLGDPKEVRRGFLRYCADGGGQLLVGQANDRSGDLGSDPKARTVIVVTTARALIRRAPRTAIRGRHWVAITHLRGKRLRAALRRSGV